MNPPRRFLPPLSLILLAAAALRLLLVERHGMRNNDLITCNVMQLPLGEIFHERLAKNHVPLYFMALKIWILITGEGETALQLPSVLIGLASVAAAGWVALAMFGVEAGLCAALLSAIHQQWLLTSVEVRNYGPLMLFSLVALGAAWRWIRTHRVRWAFAYAAAVILGALTHMLVLMVVLSLLLWLVTGPSAAGESKRRTALVLIAPVLVMLPFILLYAHTQTKVGHEHWQLTNPGRLIRNVTLVMFGDYDAIRDLGFRPVRYALWLILDASIAAALLWRLRGPRTEAEVAPGWGRALDLLVWVAAVPPVGLYVASLKSEGMIGMERYLSVSTAVAPLLLVAAWMGVTRSRVRRAGLSACFAATALVSLAFGATKGEGIRESMEFLSRESGDLFATDRWPTRLCSRQHVSCAGGFFLPATATRARGAAVNSAVRGSSLFHGFRWGGNEGWSSGKRPAMRVARRCLVERGARPSS